MIPQKLDTYFRLCDEAYRRLRPIVCADKGERYFRWERAYDYKRKQVIAAEQGIRGHNAYYDCIISLALHRHSDDNRVAQAALDAAKQILIELNKGIMKTSNKLKTIDLCGRLPYGVCCLLVLDDSTEVVRVSSVETDTGAVVLHGDIYPKYIDDWLAYLRPMDSMTDAERKEWEVIKNDCGWGFDEKNFAANIDWLNARHFDYRGLIQQGLALEAPKHMYNTKNQ